MKDILKTSCIIAVPILTGTIGYLLGTFYNSEELRKVTKEYYKVSNKLELERIETRMHYKELIDFFKNGSVDPFEIATESDSVK